MNEVILPRQKAGPHLPDDKDTETRLDLICSLGFWSAVVATGIGIIYFLVIVAAALTGQMTFPPPGWLQLAGGLISLFYCPVIVAVMVSLHTVAPPEKRAFSQLALSFTLLFATVVTINRFVQLGVVRQSLALGETEGITWFLAYGERSIMFALEILGWGWFLGLALLFAIPVFANRGYQRWLRWLLCLYGVLALTSAAAHLLGSPLTAVGFVAWGFALYLITALLAFYFQQTAILHAGGGANHG
jgi:hypothetical protein